MGILTDQLRRAATTVAGIGDGSACYTALNDDELLAAQTQVGVLRRNAEKHAARIAGEIARRSFRELGYGPGCPLITRARGSDRQKQAG